MRNVHITTTLIQPCESGDDTLPTASRDDDPQSGGSQGNVYDLDFPRIQSTGAAPVGAIGRIRVKFRQWAEVNMPAGAVPPPAGAGVGGQKVSADFPWFSRISIIKTSTGDQLRTDVAGDNASGTGSTNVTWNLQ